MVYELYLSRTVKKHIQMQLIKPVFFFFKKRIYPKENYFFIIKIEII